MRNLVSSAVLGNWPLAAVFFSVSAFCQTPLPSSSATDPDLGEAMPAYGAAIHRELTWVGRPVDSGVTAVPQTRQIDMYKVAPDPAQHSPAVINTYLHTPVFALKHPIPYRSVADSNGSETWQVVLLISSPTIRGHLTNELKVDPVITGDPQTNLNAVNVQPFHLEGGTAVCYAELREDKVLATGKITEEAIGSDWRYLSLKVPDPKAFRQVISDRDAHCLLRYTYLRRQVQLATAVGNASASVRQAVEDEQAAERVRGVAFATDKSKLQQTLQARLSLATDTNSRLAQSLLPTKDAEQISAQVYKVSSFDFANPTPLMQSKVESYLAADVQSIVNRQTATEKQEANSSSGVGLELSIGVLKITPLESQSLKDTHELTTENTTTLNQVKPGTIHIYQLVDDARDVAIQVVESIAISKATSDNLPVSVDIDLALSAEDAEKSIGADKLAPVATGMMPGMAFCYFGKDIPTGWALLDGATTWPKETWVPEQIQGKSLPNMRGTTAVGASTLAEVGTSKLNTQFDFPEWTEDAYVLDVSPKYLLPGFQPGPTLSGRHFTNPENLFPNIDGVLPQRTAPAVYAWKQVKVIQRGTLPSPSMMPPVSWTDSTREPWAKCRWVVRF